MRSPTIRVPTSVRMIRIQTTIPMTRARMSISMLQSKRLSRTRTAVTRRVVFTVDRVSHCSLFIDSVPRGSW